MQNIQKDEILMNHVDLAINACLKASINLREMAKTAITDL